MNLVQMLPFLRHRRPASLSLSFLLVTWSRSSASNFYFFFSSQWWCWMPPRFLLFSSLSMKSHQSGWLSVAHETLDKVWKPKVFASVAKPWSASEGTTRRLWKKRFQRQLSQDVATTNKKKRAGEWDDQIGFRKVEWEHGWRWKRGKTGAERGGETCFQLGCSLLLHRTLPEYSSASCTSQSSDAVLDRDTERRDLM